MSENGDQNVTRSIDSAVLGKLPNFDGKSNVRQFLRAIIKRGKLEKWSDEEQANVTKYLCTGFAETFIDSQPDIDDRSFRELSQILMDRFTSKLSTSEAYAQLLKIKQNHRSIDEYAVEIETKAADVVDVIDDLARTDSRNELLVSVFLSGLDPHLKRLLAATDFVEFTEIVQAAKGCAETYTDTRPARGVNTVEQQPPNRLPHTSDYHPQNRFKPNSQIVCWYCGQYGHIQRYCRYQQGFRNEQPIHSNNNNNYNSKN